MTARVYAQKKSVAFMWPGLPNFGARLIRAYINSCTDEISVIATKPTVPIEGMEEVLGQKVHWLEDNAGTVTWQSLGLKVPDYIFQSGRNKLSLNALASQGRAVGSKIILMNDQNWTGGFLQRFVDPIRHRILFTRRYCGVLTPGKLGLKYNQAMGFDMQRVLPGLLGADPELFNGGKPLSTRPKTFLFVGELVDNKNVLALANAFVRMTEDYPDWTLRICGSGPLQSQLPIHSRIKIEGFVQPHALAQVFAQSRCLVLPSFVEHWGLVVHEAALSGCALILSNTIGSRLDFVGQNNGLMFPPADDVALENTLRNVAEWDDSRWQKAETESRCLATGFGPQQFQESAHKLIEMAGVVDRKLYPQ
jgi:glycosyltransferase involved in cell wall biosynthesis